MRIINTVELQGTVSDCSNGKVWIVSPIGCGAPSSCKGGCDACGGKKSQRRIMVETKCADQWKSGARVTVRTFMVNEAVGACIVFGIPLLTTLCALGTWYAIDPATVESGRALLLAGTAFLFGFIFVWIIDRLFRKRFPSAIVSAETAAVLSTSLKRTNAHG